VAAAEVEPEEIVYPIRSMFQNRGHARFVIDEVTGIDLKEPTVSTARHMFPYDFLIISAGSISHFFDVAGKAEHAFQLKTLEQAVALRKHILLRFERSLCTFELAARRRMLSFAIVGGGPTGVEFVSALSELICGPLRKDYPVLKNRGIYTWCFWRPPACCCRDSRSACSAMPRIICGEWGVDVRFGSAAVAVSAESITLKDGTEISTETTIWTACVCTTAPAFSAGPPVRRIGQVEVLPTLQVPGHPEIYVIGDRTYLEEHGAPLRMNASVAIQQGKAAAGNILRQLQGLSPRPFRYREMGKMVTIGRNAAATELVGRSFFGFPAWMLWLGVHLFNLIGFRNLMLVIINWDWNYLLFDRAVRLIITLPVDLPRQIKEPD
jgi:NADH dehydrogenase